MYTTVDISWYIFSLLYICTRDNETPAPPPEVSPHAPPTPTPPPEVSPPAPSPDDPLTSETDPHLSGSGQIPSTVQTPPSSHSLLHQPSSTTSNQLSPSIPSRSTSQTSEQQDASPGCEQAGNNTPRQMSEEPGAESMHKLILLSCIFPVILPM